MALGEGASVVASESWHSVFNHTTELMPAIARLMQNRDVRPGDLDAVAVALGPGGFSALRTGLSVAKGLAVAARIPIIGIGSLDLEGYPFRRSGLILCVLMEAGRGEVSSALIGTDPARSRLREDKISGPDELLQEVEGLTGGDKLLFCGEGLIPWADKIEAHLGTAAIICHVSPSSRAESLAVMAWQRLQAGESDNIASLQPHYLRMPSIGTAKRRDRRRQASAGRNPRLQQAT